MYSDISCCVVYSFSIIRRYFSERGYRHRLIIFFFQKDQPLGGWVLKRSVDGGDEATYKFTSKYVLKGGAEVTVWSTGSGEKQDLPTDIVGKNVESWGVGEKINTTLIDASGEVRQKSCLKQQLGRRV